MILNKGLDGMGRQPPSIMGLQHCHGHGNNQLMRLNAAGQLGVGQYFNFITPLKFHCLLRADCSRH